MTPLSFAGNLTLLLQAFRNWATNAVQLDRFWVPLSPATAGQICSCISRLSSFAQQQGTPEIKQAMQLETIFSFAEDLLLKGRKNKYVADQVCVLTVQAVSQTYPQLQALCILTFGRFFFLYDDKRTFETSRWTENIRSLSSSLKHGRDNAYGSRYLTMDMPAYTSILQKVEHALSKLMTLEDFSNAPPNEIRAWEVQSAAVIALQTMLPPLRGRPYWDLDIADNGTNSMLPGSKH